MKKTTNKDAENPREEELSMDTALHELFLNELKDMYWAEKYLVKSLPKMIEKATSGELKQAIESHLQETKGHVTRLEKVFQSLNEEPDTKKCEAMDGLVSEAEELMDDTEDGSMVRDVAIISAAQKVEHYEIASYGTLRTLAAVMAHKEAEELLSETLEEEKNADSTLTRIAETFVNEHAKDERK